MSEAKVCDRCGTYYVPSYRTCIVRQYISSGVTETRNGGDLCADCSAKYKKWWAKPKGNVGK